MKRNSKPIGDLKREQFSVQASVFRGALKPVMYSVTAADAECCSFEPISQVICQVKRYRK